MAREGHLQHYSTSYITHHLVRYPLGIIDKRELKYEGQVALKVTTFVVITGFSRPLYYWCPYPVTVSV